MAPNNDEFSSRRASLLGQLQLPRCIGQENCAYSNRIRRFVQRWGMEGVRTQDNCRLS